MSILTIMTAHFGEVDIDEENILCFDKGLPGLEEDKSFALLSNEDSKPIAGFNLLTIWKYPCL